MDNNKYNKGSYQQIRNSNVLNKQEEISSFNMKKNMLDKVEVLIGKGIVMLGLDNKKEEILNKFIEKRSQNSFMKEEIIMGMEIINILTLIHLRNIEYFLIFLSL